MADDKKNKYGRIKGGSEHTANARGSTGDKHAKGRDRVKKDGGHRKAHLTGKVKPNANTARGRQRAEELKQQKKGKGKG